MITSAAPRLEDLISVTFEDAVALTHLPKRQIEELVYSGRVRSFRLGKRRYINAQSLRALIDELCDEDARHAGRPVPLHPEPSGRPVGARSPPPAPGRIPPDPLVRIRGPSASPAGAISAEPETPGPAAVDVPQATPTPRRPGRPKGSRDRGPRRVFRPRGRPA
jgi:hypothetical protein